MPVIGSFARVESAEHDDVRARVAALPGVSTFDLGTREKLGILIESDDLETAQALVSRGIPAIAGVLGVWPVSVQMESQLPDPEEGQEDAC